MGSLGWNDSVKEFCHLMVKLNGFFSVVTTLLFSDPVILLEIVDSSSCLSVPIPIEVGVCSVMVNSQLMNHLEIIIYL